MKPLTLDQIREKEPVRQRISSDRSTGDSIVGVPRWKRTIDLIFSIVLVALFAPLMIGTALAVRLTSKGPVIFRQTRIGMNGHPFTILKFRTMQGVRDQASDRESFRLELQGLAAANEGLFVYQEMRYTLIGKFLRRYSIDELPQLFNVIKGDMSLVGPRPAVPWEVAEFAEEYRRRHLTPPGITGLWQISGRNRLTARQMLELDIRYIEDRSLLFDLKILLETPRAVLFDRLTA